jgi:hypothetical protein
MLGTKIVCHPGGTFGHSAFIGFDKVRKRGVVVLASSDCVAEVRNLGVILLESEWQSEARPKETRVSSEAHDSYVGEYQIVPNFALGLLTLRILLLNLALKDMLWPAGCCIGVVVVVLVLRRFLWVRRLWTTYVLRWRPASARKRWVLKGGLALVGIAALGLTPVAAGYVVYAVCRPVMGIRRDGERLFLQPVRMAHIPVKFLSEVPIARLRLPPIDAELLPESQDRYFERISGLRMEFSRSPSGKVIRLTTHALGKAFAYEKISEQAPQAFKQPVAIKLDPKLYDTYVGRYEFGPDGLFPDGINLTIRHLGDKLAGKASDKNGGLGDMDIYAESATNFFLTIGVHLVFNTNDKREVTSVIRRVPGWPDSEGKKVPAPAK